MPTITGATLQAAAFHASAAVGTLLITSTTSTSQAYLRYTANGTNYYVGVDDSTGAFFGTGSPYAYVIYTPGTGNLALWVNKTTNAVTIPQALTASTLTTSAPTGGAGTWKLGVANVVSPTSPNRTIAVDIGGTTYYIHAKTTNN